MTRAPAFSLSAALEGDVMHITPRVALTLFVEGDSFTRPDLPDKDPLSSLGTLGVGVGIFYVSAGSVAFGLESAPSFTFDSQDLVGAGFSTRATLYPFYVPLSEAARRDADKFSAWVRSSFSLWALARVDFTGDGNGSTLAFGASIDLARILFLPYAAALAKAFR